MIKAVIFDLDNTLYDQREYIKLLLKLISRIISQEYGLESEKNYHWLIDHWIKKGPFYKYYFDDVVTHFDLKKEEIRRFIDISQTFKPDTMQLYPEAEKVLSELKKKYRLFLLTDGNVLAQRNKIEALKISGFFEKIIFTAEFKQKPHPSSYLEVLNSFSLNANEVACVGDNPLVDFCSPNELRMITIRIKKGYFKDEIGEKNHEAKTSILELNSLPSLLARLSKNSESL